MIRRFWRWLFPRYDVHFDVLALDFANRYPFATRAQWVEFVSRAISESYRAGYVAGRRATDAIDADLPELIADTVDPDWRDIAAASPDGLVLPLDVVQERFDEANARRWFGDIAGEEDPDEGDRRD